MSTRCVSALCVIVFFLLSECAVGASAPPVTELLDKYTQALDATQSFTDTYTEVCDYSYRMPDGSTAANAKRFARGQHRADGTRLYMQDYYWGDVNPQLMDLPESDCRYHLRIEAGERLYSHSAAVNDPRVKGSAGLQHVYRERAAVTKGPHSGIYGYLGSEERLDAVLRSAREISMRPATETINGIACHVIDAGTQCGRYTVWLDPAHGYHAAKVTRQATGGDKENEWLMARGDQARGSVVITRFEQIGGVWVPMEADQQTAYTSGALFRREHGQYKRANIVLNPDHDKLGSFDNPLEHPANDPELKNGTRVHIIEAGAIKVKGFWQDGKIVDASGKAVDIQASK